MESKAIKKIDKGLSPDSEWQEIVDRLVDELGDDLPDRVVKATELLLAGWPTYKVAKEVGTNAATVKGWLKRYPTMAMAVESGSKLLTKWRMAKLEQQFTQAIEKSEEVLNLDLTDHEVNTKLVGTIAQHARYIIGLYAGQKMDVRVTVEEGAQTLKAKQDALDYIAAQVNQQRDNGEVIEASYRVVDVDAAAANNRPLLDDNGQPFYGELGKYDTNEDGTLCHVCGKRQKSLAMHVGLEHRMKQKEYELCFMLEPGSLSAGKYE